MLMFHHLFHPLRVLWDGRITFFWPIWLSITSLAVILAVWIVSAKSNKAPLEQSESSRQQDRPRESIGWVVALGLLLVCYVGGILAWEDFTYYDNSHFTSETLVGRDISLQVSPIAGRFWPLGHQEFNLLRHITNSISGYHALRILQLIAVCSILLVLDKQLDIRVRVALIFLLLITPGIVISFSGLIYPEANVIVCLVCLAWSVDRFGRTPSLLWAVVAVLSAQLLLYYKETAFLFVLGFAGGRIVLRCRKNNEGGWDWKHLRDPESRLDVLLVGLVGVFLLYYFAALYPHFGGGYEKEHKLPLLTVLGTYLELDLLLCIFVSVCAVRAFLVFRRRLAPWQFWDGLAFGGILYLCGYLVLGIESSYYLAPVDFIAVLYIGRLAILSVPGMGLSIRLGALALLFLVCVQDFSLSAFRMYERKNIVRGKAEVGRAIKDRYENDPQSVKRLFFPTATPFSILEFASYLQYIGVPIEQRANNTGAADGVLLVGRSIQSDGPCGYRAYLCHPGSIPNSGDLVVVLPDDITSVEETNSYRKESSVFLFSYDPRPSISQSMRPIVNRLHAESPIFAFRQLPDSWLMASVSVWR